jgi:hypothetical protein
VTKLNGLNLKLLLEVIMDVILLFYRYLNASFGPEFRSRLGISRLLPLGLTVGALEESMIKHSLNETGWSNCIE